MVHSLHFPQFQEREYTQMAGIQRSKLPVLRVGKTATEPIISITDNGQIRFNKLAAEVFGDSKSVMLYDFNDKRELSIVGYTGKLPKGWTEEDLFALPAPSEDAAKHKGVYINAAAALRQLGYDYKASGSQNFKELGMNKEKRLIRFTVPAGALAKIPSAPRAPRKPKEATTAAAAGKPAVAAEAEGELDLTI